MWPLAKNSSKSGKVFFLCTFWITYNNKQSMLGKCYSEWRRSIYSFWAVWTSVSSHKATPGLTSVPPLSIHSFSILTAHQNDIANPSPESRLSWIQNPWARGVCFSFLKIFTSGPNRQLVLRIIAADFQRQQSTKQGNRGCPYTSPAFLLKSAASIS